MQMKSCSGTLEPASPCGLVINNSLQCYHALSSEQPGLPCSASVASELINYKNDPLVVSFNSFLQLFLISVFTGISAEKKKQIS